MHDHDHDLIAALAEGILGDELASTAEAEITACPECASELAAQRFALRALEALPPASLTLSEAARLRDGVAAALGVADAPVPHPAKRSRRSAWTAIAVAAGLAGVITIIPVMGLLTPGSDDDSATTVAAALESADTNPAPTSRDGTAEAPLEESQVAATSEAAEVAAAGAEAATTTAAPMLMTDPGDLGTGADGEEAIKQLFEVGPMQDYVYSTEQAERAAPACSAEAEQRFGDAYLYVTTPASLDDGRPVVLYAAADWSALVAFDVTDCSPVLAIP